MASTQTKRLPTQVLQADIDAYIALKAITGYQSVNAAYTLAAVAELHDSLKASLETEIHTQNALAAARDAAVAAQWDFHQAILGVKNQVKALYGADSDQVAALGLKKKSERKAPAKANKAAAMED
jgi:hypothetical protein